MYKWYWADLQESRCSTFCKEILHRESWESEERCGRKHNVTRGRGLHTRSYALLRGKLWENCKPFAHPKTFPVQQRNTFQFCHVQHFRCCACFEPFAREVGCVTTETETRCVNLPGPKRIGSVWVHGNISHLINNTTHSLMFPQDHS